MGSSGRNYIAPVDANIASVSCAPATNSRSMPVIGFAGVCIDTASVYGDPLIVSCARSCVTAADSSRAICVPPGISGVIGCDDSAINGQISPGFSRMTS